MLNILRKLMAILPSRDKGKLAGLFVLMLVGSLLEVVGVGAIPLFVAVLQNPDRLFGVEWLNPVWEVAGITTATDMLIWGSVALVVIFLVKNAYVVFVYFVQARYVFSRFGFLATELFQSYMMAEYTFHLGRNTASLIRNVTNETREITYNVLRGMLRMAMDAVVMLGIFALLFVVEPTITLIALLVLGGVGGFFLTAIKNRLRRHGKRAVLERGRIIQAVTEGIGGFKDTTILHRQQWFVERFRQFVQPLVDALTFRQVTDKAVKPTIEIIAVSGMVLIALLLLWQGRAVSDIIPLLTLFGAATVRLMPAFQSFINEYNKVRFNAYAVEPVYDDLTELRNWSRVRWSHDDSECLPLENEIKIQNVSFSYPEAARPAIQNLSLRIPAGEAVGLIGPSGAGKTTLVDLILGLFQPSEGYILVDGRDIGRDMVRWQRNLGYVPQFIYLADTTIRKNIAFGLPDEEIDDDQLWEAVRSAQIEGFIKDLPDGLDTSVGEHGMQFSGGQRQRIGIARALYNRPQVLVMDEATSSLDNHTERFVMDAIESLKGERTIIIIAHRMSTVTKCDRIAVMANGRLQKIVTDYRDVMDQSGKLASFGST